ncbi:class A sortase [Enterococcus faecium]|uniref:Class A sortase n=1 Tax=Vagococcus vulneris TaxID=1977869 RepID=A0A430A2J9_9ENTE|nr:class A sortase [Enterococcus faecium]RSU00689.1 class A sortase [Vagococcus vulneris]EJX53362.1 sortase family protein [Enterococcus faecium R497]MCH3314641.1 class A sortase [Enterococcus faecium]MCU1820880.1 class A sortase [Enterococcus faecium]MDT6801641.1 class A sortase [Enterococcus faecium]
MKKILVKLPLLWLIVGLLASGFYIYGYTVLLRSDNQIQQVRKVVHPIQSKKEADSLQQSKTEQGNFDETQIKPVTPAQYANAQLNYEKLVNSWGIGSVFIPSSNVHSKILAGMSNDNLMVGLGTYYPDQKLGKGNYVMMAHNLVQGGGVLRDLPQTTVGTIVFVTDFTTIYEYVVDLNKTVNQSEGHLLDPPEKEKPALITIFRCEGGLHTPNRSLIQAKFHKSYPANEGTHVVKENLGLEKAISTPGEQILGGSDNNEKDTSSVQSTSEQATESEEKDSGTKGENKRFIIKKPVYNRVDTFSIHVFKLFNTSPLCVALTFILGMLIFSYGSNRVRRIK